MLEFFSTYKWLCFRLALEQQRQQQQKHSFNYSVYTFHILFGFEIQIYAYFVFKCEYTTNTIQSNWIELNWMELNEGKKTDQSKYCKTVKSIAKNRLDATSMFLCTHAVIFHLVLLFYSFHLARLIQYTYKQTYVEMAFFGFAKFELNASNIDKTNWKWKK